MRLAFLPSLLLFVTLVVVPGPSSLAQEDTPTDEQVVEQILELQRQIDRLLIRLPPEFREKIRRQLATGEIAAPPVPELSSEAAPQLEPPQSTPPPPSPPSPPKTRRSRRAACNTLEAFDTNDDGTVDALDRYWRHLYLWFDRNHNGQVDKREVVSTFEEKVKDIATDLDAFSTFKRGRGEIRLGERILLDLRGNGFDPARSRDDAVLMVDASALRRGTGPVLLSTSGQSSSLQELEGMQPFKRGLRLRDSEGNVTRLNCP